MQKTSVPLSVFGPMHMMNAWCSKWEFISRGLLYIVLCDSADGLWEEDVRAKVGVGKWLDVSYAYMLLMLGFLEN